jgi:SAM-dependent methyltransferase
MSDEPLPFGSLSRLHSERISALENFSTLDLLRELSARFSGGEVFPASEEAFAVGKLLQDSLASFIDVHNNRFSRQRLWDYYYAYIRPHSSTRPPIQGTTWVEIGSGSQNPAAFLFLILMLGAQRGIAVDPDPIQNPSMAWKALADMAGLLLIDPKCVLELEECDPHEMLRNISSFDLAKLRAGNEEGIDSSRFIYLQESVESLSLPDDTADVVISNAFLEHVEDLDKVAQQLFRITRPGGLGVHTIDGKDHRMYSDSSVHPLAFLEIEDSKPIVEGCNRIRPFAMRVLFERAGFEMVEKEVFEQVDVTQEMREHFVEPFRSMSQEDLEVLCGLIVIRKPAY